MDINNRNGMKSVGRKRMDSDDSILFFSVGQAGLGWVGLGWVRMNQGRAISDVIHVRLCPASLLLGVRVVILNYAT